jgi:hypothetical protein
MRYALLLTLCLCSCGGAVRRMLILHEEITSKVGPDHVITRLDRSFLEANRYRISLTTDVTVDAAARINPKVFDGDIHIAVRTPDVQLRLVAEIMNAKTAPAAVALVRNAEKSRAPLRMTGVLRFWPEHAIGLPHRQGEEVERLSNANPDHVFELHPVLRVGDLDLLATMKTVEGYRPGSASTTFETYQKSDLALRVVSNRVYLTTPAGLWNDVHFQLELTDAAPSVREDGRYLTARARDTDGILLVDSIRVVLVRDSPPERALRDRSAGTRFHVWGLPRVSFDGLVRLVAQTGSDTQWRTARLPYEILILGIYPEGQ